jgi:DNA-binding FadR family transcriptional regulator
MEDVLSRVEKAVARGETVAQVAAAFHVAVARASHNCVLEKLVRSFTSRRPKRMPVVSLTVSDFTRDPRALNGNGL